jgi:hypothetical protein
MVERAGSVARPDASVVHSLDDLDEAVGFICRDSGGMGPPSRS